MTRRLDAKPAGPIMLAPCLLGLVFGCGEGRPPRHLTRVQAFLCSQPRQADCTSLPRGKPIPRDSLPPSDEAFQLWAWHPGHGAVQYRTEWRSRFFNDTAAPLAPRQSGTDYNAAGDSTMLAYNFANATRTRYIVRVLLVSPGGKIEDQDSLVWDYSQASPAASMNGKTMHH